RDQGAVTLQVVSLQVAKDAAALAHHLQQAAARVMVLAVGAQVLGELVDALGEQRDLDLGRSGVLARTAVLADQLLLLVLRQRHRRDRVAIQAPRPSYLAQISFASATSRCICATRSSTLGNRFSPRSRLTKATRRFWP